ncbi:hypothetical protein NE237_004669 [Protea cynaroides]|uniref:Aminotransferase-like plant mobile domain-containing protein n=1 Tax=Protea cynaroides TaxID=273540 RepID=A0A9Q0KJE2_9MAGN|nr:hypothetical protein NE237_004669 [Protea cynaroides]
MANQRRNSYPNNPTSENPLHTQTLSISSMIFFLKRPHAFPFLLSIFILLTWVFLRLQHLHHFPSPQQTPSREKQKWSREDDEQANLFRFSTGFPSQIAKDKRGWLLNPVTAAIEAGISGGAISCASIHVGEIRPGGMRANHRHYTCNETLVIWGAETKFRLENNHLVDKGFAEVTIGAEEVAVAASPSGIAHAIVNVDLSRTTFFLGCQDNVPSRHHSTVKLSRKTFDILAQGTAIALGPAGLASLYRDLRFIKEQSVHKLLGLNKECHYDDFHLSVWAPFQLMQLWIWERFPSWRPKKPNSLRPGEPRAALWSKLSTNMSIELVRLVMSSLENFQLQSFCHCLWVSELTGLDSIYLPYRVAMQFGLDQDIPGHFGLPKESCGSPLNLLS